MHTIRPTPGASGETWQIIFVTPGVVEVVLTQANFEMAMAYCSYLNGGMCPTGYVMDVNCHH